MTVWTSDELDKIGGAEELEIAFVRRDGTLSKPVPIWVVRHEDAVYVRSGYGPSAAWFRGAQRSKQGRILAGGIAKNVAFETVDHTIDHAIDTVYRDKYRDHGAEYVDLVVSPEARTCTIKLAPR